MPPAASASSGPADTDQAATPNIPQCTPSNTPKHDASDKRWRPVEAAMRRNGYRPGGLIEALHAVQRSYGYIDDASMRALGATMQLPLSKIYGVVTFYHFFHLKPKGRHTCVVCLGTACYIKGADRLLQAISREQQMQPGETSADGRLSLLTARCVGSCGQAPAVVIDDLVQGQAEGSAINRQLARLNGREEERPAATATKGPPAAGEART
ncbi:NAD(P)H-dependent oxidoreductase subunit E [Desulfurivibrio dismutans]|uniref:NAD(P)H-dependent oxidoreductase subunit E n=1 Tax=Desulfurivibrio dismutans TaxID=1398908 RepID=UPI0023DAB079|nr:NAD(P)H-dependent oxidoreductase subunit E [Desulfurivibrio alkaliphilus]MDF1613496.1 NAD(P)H-dependent oxidoreductase subunit E [Desulfurivibrio alkaliphilus]